MLLLGDRAITVDVEESWLDALGAWAALAAALVTAVTAVLIWLQIRQTNRSVAATEEALKFARAEQELSRELRTDAQKAHIDSELPKILVTVSAQSRSAHDPSETNMYGPAAYEAGHYFELPADKDKEVLVSFWVTIYNDGPRSARLSVGTRNSNGVGGPVSEVVVRVGEKIELHVKRKMTVEDWVAIASGDYTPLGHVGEHGWDFPALEVIYSHQGTAGAVERWVVRQGGSPLRAVPGDPSRWRVGNITYDPRDPEGTMNAGPDFPEREYFSSMAEGRRL